MKTTTIKKNAAKRTATTSGWAAVTTLPKVNVAKLGRDNRVYLHPVCDMGDGRFVVETGWKLVGWNFAPYPSSGNHAICYEKLTRENDGGGMNTYQPPGLYWGHGDAHKMLFGGTLTDEERRQMGPWLPQPNK